MPETASQENTVSRGALVVSVLLAVILTSVIVGSITFAWQNSRVTHDDLFRQQLLETETNSLERQIDIVIKEEK